MDGSAKRNQQPHINITLDLRLKGAPLFFAEKISRGLAQGITAFKLRVKSEGEACFPNICTPIAGMIDYFTLERGCTFIPSKSWQSNQLLAHSGILHPYSYNSLSSPTTYLNKVWKFTRGDHFEVVSGIIDSVRRTAVLPSGVAHGLELALNEVTDNILYHSLREANSPDAVGYVMVQYHRTNQRIAVAVFDLGQGIPSSLASGKVAFNSKESALEAAVRKGVGDGTGGGNGLWMMERIVSSSHGSFELTSDGARFACRHHSDCEKPKASVSSVSQIKDGTTLVDFQLHTDRPLDLVLALGAEHANLWLEDHSVDATHIGRVAEALLVSVSDESRGCASRYEAQFFATMVGNLMEEAPGLCVLDFGGVETVSASFADELLVRLIRRFGIVSVIQRIAFRNLSSINAAIFNQCFEGRLPRNP